MGCADRFVGDTGVIVRVRHQVPLEVALQGDQQASVSKHKPYSLCDAVGWLGWTGTYG